VQANALHQNILQHIIVHGKKSTAETKRYTKTVRLKKFLNYKLEMYNASKQRVAFLMKIEDTMLANKLPQKQILRQLFSDFFWLIRKL